MAEKGRQKRTKSLVEERGRWESLSPREWGESGSYVYMGWSEIEGRGGGLMICEMWSFL